jgi:hypothetical protein
MDQYLPILHLRMHINHSFAAMAELEEVEVVEEEHSMRNITGNLVVVGPQNQAGIVELSLRQLLRLKSQHLVQQTPLRRVQVLYLWV